MKGLPTIWLFKMVVILCFGCQGQKALTDKSSTPPTTSISNDEAPPDWVTNGKSVGDAYVGIGSAPVSLSNYHRIAKDAALEDLASDIEVAVKAKTRLFTSEYGHGMRQWYDQQISTYTQRSLTDYELTDEWTGGRYYWVRYQLLKDTYRNSQLLKKQKASQQINALITEATRHEQQGRAQQAIQSYLEAMTHAQVFPEVTWKDHSNHQQLAFIYCRGQINKVLSQISLRDTVLYVSPAHQTPSLTLYYQDQALADFPVNVNQTSYQTDAEGTIKPDRVLLSQKALVHLQLKPAPYQNPYTQQAETTLYQFFAFPSFAMPVKVLPVSLSLTGIGQEWHKRQFDPLLAAFLLENGYVVDTQPMDSVGSLRYQIEVDDKVVGNGFYGAWASLTVEVLDQQQKILYSHRISQVKGVHPDQSRAVALALTNLGKRLHELDLSQLLFTQ